MPRDVPGFVSTPFPEYPMVRSVRPRFQTLAVLFLGLSISATVQAGKIVLKSGFVIEGTPVRVPGLDSHTAAILQGLNVPPRSPYWLVDDGIRRYFIHRLNLAEGPDAVDQSDDTSRYVVFKLQHLRHRTGRLPAIIGTPRSAEPWDKHGRSLVTLDTPRGPEDIQLALFFLHPKYLRVESTSHDWEFAIPTNSLPVPRLREIMHGQIDVENPEERFAIVRFFLDANLPVGARLELDSMKADFPEMKAKIGEMQSLLMDRYGLQALDEIIRRKAIGQHRLAQLVAASALKEDLPAEVIRSCQEILDDYRQAKEKSQQAADWLSLLQADLSPEQAQRVMPLRSLLLSELNYDTLDRLEPFLNIVEDNTLPPQERLALAYSAWVVGPANAVTQWDEAMNYWAARSILLRFLHPQADRADREVCLRELQELEGISTRIVAQMIPQLPIPMEPPVASDSGILSLEVPTSLDETAPARYSVLLPPEYNPARAYPAIVVLRAEGKTIEQTLELFGGTPKRPGVSRRQGYIVIAPHYAAQDQEAYDWGKASHEIILRSLFDARTRFHIDSDRIFVSGHGMGGDAALDMALSHPDLWAGCIPFLAQFDYVARMYSENAREMPFYFVGGERDRDLLTRNAKMFAKLMQRGQDMIFCEFKGRGFESYAEELPRIFEWMSRYRRNRTQNEWNVYTVRDFNNRFGWVKALGLPERLSRPVVWDDVRTYPRRLPIRATYHSAGNVINVSLNPGSGTILYLSPEMVDFERVLQVRVKGKTKFRDYPEPNIETLLEELRERGDRQLLYWAKLVL